MTAQAQPETTVAFVLYPGLTPLDLIGPLQVFATLGTFSQLGLPVPPTRTVVVGEQIEPMDSDTPVKLTPSATFDQLPDPTIVIVPGGGMPTVRAASNEAILQYVRSAADTAQVCASVCTGALILAAAGLLEGRPAGHHPLGLLAAAGAARGPLCPRAALGRGRQVHHLGRGLGRHRHGPGPGRPPHRRADRPDGPVGDRVRPAPTLWGIDWGQVDRDIYEPMLGPIVQRQLADRPELLAKLSG